MFSRKNNAEVLTALATKAISANVMVADDNFNIVYMNEAVTALLRQAEPDLKKDLPQFSVDRLIGTNIDIFHKNPSHQRQMLQSLRSVHRATIKVGKWTFDLIASPLNHVDGRRAGTVVEWADASIRLQKDPPLACAHFDATGFRQA
jgi:methyl-accepting chemotaxis protein